MTGRVNLASMRQYVDTTMTATGQLGTIERVMDPVTLAYVDTFVPHWTGRLMLWPLQQDEDVTAGEAAFHVSRYTVVMTDETPVKVGDRLKVTSSPDGPFLETVDLTIVDAPVAAWQVARQCVAEVVTTP